MCYICYSNPYFFHNSCHIYVGFIALFESMMPNKVKNIQYTGFDLNIPGFFNPAKRMFVESFFKQTIFTYEYQ